MQTTGHAPHIVFQAENYNEWLQLEDWANEIQNNSNLGGPRRYPTSRQIHVVIGKQPK